MVSEMMCLRSGGFKASLADATVSLYGAALRDVAKSITGFLEGVPYGDATDDALVFDLGKTILQPQFTDFGFPVFALRCGWIWNGKPENHVTSMVGRCGSIQEWGVA